MADGDLKLSNSPNVDTGLVEKDGSLHRAVLTETPEGTLQLSDSANVSTGYVTDSQGKKHKVNLVAEVQGDLELSDNINVDTGYVTDGDGKKHKVKLTASLRGGGSTPVIDELNVTPSTSAQTITAPEGTDGYSPVKVAAVTSAIDANITAGNIKKDVQILGVTGSYEGSAPAHYMEYPVDANGILQQPTTMSTIGNIIKIGSNALEYWLYHNTQITTVDLSSVIYIGNNGLNSAFLQSAVTSVDLRSLVYIDVYGFVDMCRGLAWFVSINLSSLKTCKSNAFSNAFRANTNLAELSFPALTTAETAAFSTMFNSTSNKTIHFPSNMQATVEALTNYPNFGGTNITVLFDLPATVILTGANSVNYERSPKDDTATALAWRVQDTGTAPNLVIDWTPYYTSGTADPMVSGTIYSDSACTTAVTTISSIA